MTTITIELPTDAFSALRLDPEDFVAEMRMAAALYWYSHGEISQGIAAQIGGITRVQFIDELARHKMDAFVVDMADLAKELQDRKEHVRPSASPASPFDIPGVDLNLSADEIVAFVREGRER